MSGAAELRQIVSRLTPTNLDAFMLYLWYLDGQRGPVSCINVKQARQTLIESAAALAAQGQTELAASCQRAAQAAQ